MKTLLIVESPAKSKTIEKLLGPGYTVLSSFGHIRNLDKKSLGIDVENGFAPNYRILTDRSKQIKAIQEAIKKVDRVLLASDEDREGEAIAWHCAIVFKLGTKDANRICFHEITKTALEHAVANPRLINMDMVYSQQARRILDRLVGFKLSPLLWKYIAPKLSAGRVQSVALKVIVDQEREIDKFTEQKNYKTVGLFDKKLNATLNKNFESQEEANKFLEDCKTSVFTIKNIIKNRIEKRPPPPYITSTIQQDSGSRFGIGAKKIMSVLQKLYEGGLITYHRTDSTNLSTHIQDEIKAYITEKLGKNYLHPRIYKSKIKCAQEAHEAIRPTKIECTGLDNSYDAIEKKIYDLIWKRTVASQMSASVSDFYNINITISNRIELFISKAEKLIFDGYKRVYDDSFKSDDADAKSDEEDALPSDFLVDNIQEGELLKYVKITSSEKYKTAPLRFNESSLIKKMEKIGIGRPSTYSGIIETIMERKYVEKKDIKGKKVEINVFILQKGDVKTKKDNVSFGGEKKKLVPSDIGKCTVEFLEKNFESILDCNFTSTLETQLDEVANSNNDWKSIIKNFYDQFIPNVNKLDDKTLISKNYDDKKRFLGDNEEGKPVYAYIGKFGPVIQIGKDKDVKFIKLDPEYSINTVTLEDLKSVSKYPLLLGSHNGNDVVVKKGMYGFYISYNSENFKLLEGFDENLNLEDAIKCIQVKSEGAKGLIKSIGEYLIKNGQYGPYIEFKKKFFKIPKNYDTENLTKEDCDAIIKLPKTTYKKK